MSDDNRVEWVSDISDLKLMQILNDLEHEFNTMKWQKNRHRTNVSHTPCFSIAFGRVFVPYHGLTQGVANQRFPQVHALLLKLAQHLHFDCTSFTINKNLPCLPHVDKRNKGSSLIVGLGCYTGGDLILHSSPTEGIPYNIHYSVLRFNGKTQLHSTAPFIGTRYSVVMYNIT